MAELSAYRFPDPRKSEVLLVLMWISVYICNKRLARENLKKVNYRSNKTETHPFTGHFPQL